MQLNIIVSDYSMNLSIPETFVEASGEAFDRLDRNMDGGVQMGRDWV